MGSLHTALFNWALARAMGGDFVLRIDDTDVGRNRSAAVAEMLEALAWLGLDWDEGPDMGGPHAPYVQSQRRERHRSIARQLLAAGHAYYGSDGDSPDSPDDAAGPLRLRMPREGQIAVRDALRGPIFFESRTIQDPVLLRSDGSPLYHLATVVDDHDMAISHVVRGDDWIASAPVHVYLYRVLGWAEPTWVHLPLVRNRHGAKLSKRDPDGGYLASDFQAAGYLPEALFNYLLLLGWSPDGEDEIVSKWQVRQQFRLERLSTSPPVFDWAKLNWVNRHYLQRESDAQLATLIRPYLEDAYGTLPASEKWLTRLAALLRDEMDRLSDAVTLAAWALSEQTAPDEGAIAALRSPAARPVLVQLIAELAGIVLLDEQTAVTLLHGLRARFEEEAGWSAREVYWPVRAALTGSVRGPALSAVMGLLGKEQCMRRLASAMRAS